MKNIVGILIVMLFLAGSYGGATNIILRDCDVVSDILMFNNPPAEEWSIHLGGKGYDLGLDAVETEEGSFLIFGTTESYGQGEHDYFLIKIDKYGNEIWNKTYGGEGDEWGRAIIHALDEGFIMVGSSNSYGEGNYDILIIKIDEDGNQEWMKTYGGNREDYGVSIVQSDSMGYIILGSTNSFGSNSANHDVLIINIDRYGEIIWEQTYGEGEGRIVKNIKKTLNNRYIILATNTYSLTSKDKSILMTIDKDGNLLSELYIQKGTTPTFLEEVIILEDEGYILAGSYMPESFNQAPLALKVDINGTIIWSNTYTFIGKLGSFWTAIHTSTNGFLLGGFKSSDNKYLPWIVKINAEGKKVWDTTIFESGMIKKILQTSDEGFLIIINENTLENNYDIGVLKLSAEIPPEKPQKPLGQSSGKMGKSYTYQTSTVHPSSDVIWYQWDWGDDTTSDWLGPYDSSAICESKHTWKTEGSYAIRVKARDSNYLESCWSDPLEVAMPKTQSNNPINQILVRLSERFPFLSLFFSLV